MEHFFSHRYCTHTHHYFGTNSSTQSIFYKFFSSEKGFTCEIEPITTDDLLEMGLKNQMGAPLFHRFFIEIL